MAQNNKTFDKKQTQMLPSIHHLAIWEACISVISEIRKNNRTCNYGCSHHVTCHRMQQSNN